MKAKVAHRIPLGSRALALRTGLAENRDPEQPLVFSSRNGTPCSDMMLTKLLRAEVPSDVPGRPAAAHGFRSSFRDWASENGYSRDLAERALETMWVFALIGFWLILNARPLHRLNGRLIRHHPEASCHDQ